MKPLLVHTRHFPPHSYSAITLFPFVFHNERHLTERELQHETVHMWQQMMLLIVFFYVLYLLFWLVGLARYRNHDRAYRSIPFERSAYRLEGHNNTRWSIMAFDWLHCLG